MHARLKSTTDTEYYVSEPALNYASHRISQNFAPKSSVKRRKTEGLNSRFDRMVETVNVIYTSDTTSYTRRRRVTSGSSSTASYDVPKTPVDMHSTLGRGRLGDDFSIIRMKPPSRQCQDIGNVGVAASSTCDTTDQDTPPTWLTDTVAALGPKHPLRDLIPSSDAHTSSFYSVQDSSTTLTSTYRPNKRGALRNENDVFAFRPPSRASYGNRDGTLDRTPKYGILASRSLASPLEQPDEPVLEHKFEQHSCPPSLYATSASEGAIVSPSLTRSTANRLRTEVNQNTEFRVEDLDYVPFSAPGPLTNSTSRVHDKAYEHPLANSLNDFELVIGPTSSLSKSVMPDIALHSYADISHALDSPCISRMPTLITSGRTKLKTPNEIHDASGARLLPDTFPQGCAPQPSLTCLNKRPSGDMSSHLRHHISPATSHRKPGRYHVYFDSPVEDPIGSDPLEPLDYELDLDYNALDFRWEKFDRSGQRSEEVESVSRSSNISDSGEANPFDKSSSVGRQYHRSQRSTSPPSVQKDPYYSESQKGSRDVQSSENGDSVVRDGNNKPTENFSSSERQDIREDSTEGDVQRNRKYPCTLKTASPANHGEAATESSNSSTKGDASRVEQVMSKDDCPPQDIPFPLPRTPIKQIQPATPRPPIARCIYSSHHRAPSLPPITVLDEEGATQDGIEESEQNLSQSSRDTIESWSAA